MNEEAQQKLERIQGLLGRLTVINTELEELLCGKPIETEEEEPVLSQGKTTPAASKGPRKCSNCGKPGHIARKCEAAMMKAPVSDGPREYVEPEKELVGKDKPITEAQYDECNKLYYDEDLGRDEIAEQLELPVKHVTDAINCRTYQTYVAKCL